MKIYKIIFIEKFYLESQQTADISGFSCKTALRAPLALKLPVF